MLDYEILQLHGRYSECGTIITVIALFNAPCNWADKESCCCLRRSDFSSLRLWRVCKSWYAYNPYKNKTAITRMPTVLKVLLLRRIILLLCIGFGYIWKNLHVINHSQNLITQMKTKFAKLSLHGDVSAQRILGVMGPGKCHYFVFEWVLTIIEFLTCYAFSSDDFFRNSIHACTIQCNEIK